MTFGERALLYKYSKKIRILCTLMVMGSCIKIIKARNVLKCLECADAVEGL